jgi:hypothetical protein
MCGNAPQLSPRDRSLVTVSSLVGQYRINELPFHLKFALENGVTREELIEAITTSLFTPAGPRQARPSALPAACSPKWRNDDDVRHREAVAWESSEGTAQADPDRVVDPVAGAGRAVRFVDRPSGGRVGKDGIDGPA